MRRQPARVLEPESVRLLLAHVEGQRHPIRNRMMILLSFKAGLRACEIAGLDWSMVLKSNGMVDDYIRIAHYIAKMGKARTIPMHQDIKRELGKLNRLAPCPELGPIIRSERGGNMTARSVVNWFSQVYQELGFPGCSSHSGRRTFITNAARLVGQSGGSLRDVQKLAGHSSIGRTG
ncbi:hypothetical protein A8B75_19045 [Sphingomonadales bacterium EhC05]|nr:hypothetical protein A8B75_19045 [Sphingomonadales bacterium EhC05]